MVLENSEESFDENSRLIALIPLSLIPGPGCPFLLAHLKDFVFTSYLGIYKEKPIFLAFP